MGSLFNECPVCGQSLEFNREAHLDSCLGQQHIKILGNRYLVEDVGRNDERIGKECEICFEEYQEGDRIARMNCLCLYHELCIQQWLMKGRSCPIHH